ncbi:MAG: hypothetical protein ACRDD8_14230 [Bacteroidales bacterium]
MANNTYNPKTDSIYQFWESTVTLDELSLPVIDTTLETKSKLDVFGIETPLIRINNQILSEREIMSLYIDCTDFIPKIELKSVFLYERFLLLNQIKDGDIISLAIRSQSDSLKIIRNDYIITNAYVSDRISSASHEGDTTTPYMITFIGELFIPNIDSENLDLSHLGTTFETVQETAKKLNLGFCANDENTSDKQVWLNYNTSPRAFLQKLKENSWKDADSFFDIWIDVYYNINYINVNKQLTSSEESLQYGALLKAVDTNFTHGANTNKSETVIFPKFLSNHTMLDGTSSYISKWHMENNSSHITSTYGALVNCNLLEHNKLNYDKSNSKVYWSLAIEPAYDKSKLASHIILRGRCKYDKDIHIDEMARANHNAVEMYHKQAWLGVQYTCTNTSDSVEKWNGNQHMNYKRAYVHNLLNLKELDKLNTYVTVLGVNTNMLRGDKIPIMLLNSSMEHVQNKPTNHEQFSNVNRFASGWYYIKGYRISWINDDTSMTSRFNETFVLTRREWTTPEEIIPIKNT